MVSDDMAPHARKSAVAMGGSDYGTNASLSFMMKDSHTLNHTIVQNWEKMQTNHFFLKTIYK